MKTFRMFVMLALCVTMLCGCAEIPVPDTVIDVPIAEETPEPLQNNQNVSSEERERAPRDSIIGDWVAWGVTVVNDYSEIKDILFDKKPIPDEHIVLFKQVVPIFEITHGEETNKYVIHPVDIYDEYVLTYNPEYDLYGEEVFAEYDEPSQSYIVTKDANTLYMSNEKVILVISRAKEDWDSSDYLSGYEDNNNINADSIIGDWVFWGSKLWGDEDEITNKPIPDEDLNIDGQCEPAFRITGGEATNEYELLLDEVESLVLSYSPSNREYIVVDDHLSAEEQHEWGRFFIMDIDTIYRCDEQGITVYKRAKEGMFVGDFDDCLSHEDSQSDSEESTRGAPEDEGPYAYNEADDPVPDFIRQMVSSYCGRYLLPNLELGQKLKLRGYTLIWAL